MSSKVEQGAGLIMYRIKEGEGPLNEAKVKVMKYQVPVIEAFEKLDNKVRW